jgi:hypothetical protein
VAEVDMRTLELDGSLNNHLVLVAVLGWGFFLALASTVAFRSWLWAFRHGYASRTLTATVVLLVAALYVGTPWVQERLARLLCWADLPKGQLFETVRFRDRPPVMPALGIGLTIGLLSALQTLRLQPRSGAKAGQDGHRRTMRS